ncbi:MAG: transketolase family protein [Proteobacteria bacterium]|nr:transketolase family protein [Pseudomonadota bacterium]
MSQARLQAGAHARINAPAQAGPIATRQAFGEALTELGADHPELLVLDADLSCSTKCSLFAKSYPERFFQMGIAEQNMAGVAAGLALCGKTVFCCSFACFIAGRFETIKISVAYNRANVKIAGTHAGLGTGEDGYSQMGLEDLALMRALPGMQVYQPADGVETRRIVAHLLATAGPAYLRLTRQNLSAVHSAEYRFRPGRLDVLHRGAELALLASGGVVAHALRASELLRADGIDASVVNVPSIKPFDDSGVRELARSHGLMVTVEDHTVIGGLGSAVSEALTGAPGTRVHRHGILDVFGESGPQADLYRRFGLDAEGIAEVARAQLRSQGPE